MLIYPSEEEPINSPFYGQLPSIGIADLFGAEKTDFPSAFTHVLGRYVKQEADPRHILACVVAMGTNMDLWKMAEVSGLGHSTLMTTARNFLRAETLHAANDGCIRTTLRPHLSGGRHYGLTQGWRQVGDCRRYGRA
jgi:hypothetical protein